MVSSLHKKCIILLRILSLTLYLSVSHGGVSMSQHQKSLRKEESLFNELLQALYRKSNAKRQSTATAIMSATSLVERASTDCTPTLDGSESKACASGRYFAG